MKEMEDQKIGTHDHLLQHCRMLGHRVPFEYCRSMNTNLPCSKILYCWKNILPIDAFIRQNYSDDEIAFCFKGPPPKLVQIYEFMRKATEKPRGK